jgi:hypothetical protein
MSDINTMSTAEIAELLRKKKADDAFARKQREHAEKVARGEIGQRGRAKGSLSLRAQILANPAAMAALVVLNSADPENALVSLVYRDVFR